MDIKQMRYFKTIVDVGNISEASKLLHISQPPLSMSMKKLEEELGVSLFIRGNRHVSLTDAGALFYQRISRIIELTDNTMEEVGALTLGPVFTIGLTPSTIPVAAPLLAAFSTAHPEVRFQIYDGSTFELQHLLDTHVIDAAFLRTPFSLKGFSSITINKEPMVAAIPKFLIEGRFNIKNGKPITLETLSQFPLSIYRRYQELLENTLVESGLNSHFFSICDDTRTSLLWVTNGRAAAIYPKSLNPVLENVYFCPIASKELETSILFVYETNKNNALLDDFKNLL